MYYVMLAAGNNEFTAGVHRSIAHRKSKHLSRVVSALEKAQQQKNGINLRQLLEALHEWHRSDAKEYAARGAKNGIAYRLWMETKQALLNNFNAAMSLPDLPMPANCPGTTLLRVYVPPGAHNEICHNFAYRWAVAAGKIKETRDATMDANVNAATMTPVLYPGGHAGYPAARAHGTVALAAGDIVAMFVVPARGPAILGHSLIAKDAHTWFSANNAGTFGVGTGRSEIDTRQNFGVVPVMSLINAATDSITGKVVGDKAAMRRQSGWVGQTNQWVRVTDGAPVHVVYRRIN